MDKIILHIDMDAFFTSCEEQNNLSLRGKAVVVGADPKFGKGRGVVSTVNYEGRKFGIKSGMPISQAYKSNPKAVFLPVNFRLYNTYSKRIMDILKSYSQKFQQLSVDEAYLDITEKAKDFNKAKILAMEMKEKIFEETGLGSSIGISTNKLVAKIASDFQKPNGLTIVKGEEIKNFLEPLNARKLYGVGPKTEERLKQMGIKTIGQLASHSREKLMDIFGVYGIYLSMSANGIGDDFVAEGQGRLSIGRHWTFDYDVDDFEIVYKAIEEMTTEIIEYLKKECYLYKTVGIIIRMHDFRTLTMARTIGHLRNDKETIIKTAKELCREFLGNKIRLIGVRVSNLEEGKGQRTIKEFFA